MSDLRKIYRLGPDTSGYIEVGDGYVKMAYDENNFILINSGGITQQGKFNIQGSPSDTTYYGLFSPQNEFAGAFTAGMISAPQYNISTQLFDLVPGIMRLASILTVVNHL